MKTQLPEKYNNSFWSKIKNLFRGIFSSKENTKLNSNIEYNKKQNKESFYKEKNECLQKKYESGEILASNLSDEQYNKIVELYNKQIKELKMHIVEKENKLKKAII